MPDIRTAHLSLMPCAYPHELLPHGDGSLDLTVEGVGDLLPEGRALLLGLRDGGWRFHGATIQDGGGTGLDDQPMRDIPMSFTKEFTPPDVPDVVADLRACGVTEDWGYPDFCWEDFREDADDDSDENGRWDVNGNRIG